MLHICWKQFIQPHIEQTQEKSRVISFSDALTSLAMLLKRYQIDTFSCSYLFSFLMKRDSIRRSFLKCDIILKNV